MMLAMGQAKHDSSSPAMAGVALLAWGAYQMIANSKQRLGA